MEETNQERVTQEVARDSQGHWLPGTSGNPAGNKPGTAISFISKLRKMLEDQPKHIDAVNQALVDLGEKPSASQLQAIRELYDRVDGKVAERHKIEELPIRIVFVPASELKAAQADTET